MRQRFDSLQGLRGFACLLVVAYHIADLEARYGLGFNPGKPVRWFGYAGVDLFFVLSGFIIATACGGDLGRPGRLPRYLFRRVWRIYPTYWAALGLGIGVYAALCPDPLFAPGWPGELVDSVLLVPQTPVPRVLPVAWTLSYELMFYAGFAALFLLPRRAAVPALVLWAVGVAGCAAAAHTPENKYAALAVSPFVLEFLAGGLIASRPVRFSGRQAAGLTLIAVAWCGVGSLAVFDPDPARLPTNHRERVLVFGVAAAVAVLALTGWERGGGRAGRRWLSAVGDASYSIYLVHTPLLVLTMYLTIRAGMPHSRRGHLAWLGLLAAAGVLPGLLVHRYIEAPLLRLSRRPARRCPGAPARSAGRPDRHPPLPDD